MFPRRSILNAVVENDVKLVGLSALMTTTVPSMERTIQLLHENTDAKIFVGGAVLTQSLCRYDSCGLVYEGRNGKRSCSKRIFLWKGVIYDRIKGC